MFKESFSVLLIVEPHALINKRAFIFKTILFSLLLSFALLKVLFFFQRIHQGFTLLDKLLASIEQLLAPRPHTIKLLFLLFCLHLERLLCTQSDYILSSLFPLHLLECKLFYFIFLSLCLILLLLFQTNEFSSKLV